jgi:lipopolysaccharide export system permease protein
MRLLQRYILFELLRVFLLLLSILTVLLVFVGVFREVSESGLGPAQVLQILPFVVPSLLPFTIPATLLLSVCVVYGRIAGDQEITAAKAAGINVLSLLWPSFALSIALTLGSLFLLDQAIPWSMANIQRTVAAAMEDIFLDLLRTNHQVSDPDRGYSITVLGVRDKTLLKPTFQYTPKESGAITVVQAQEARLEFDLPNKQVVLHLFRGQVHAPGQTAIWFEQNPYAFPLPSEISQPKPRHMTIEEIRAERREIASRLAAASSRNEIDIALALAVGNFDRFLEDDFTAHYRQAQYDQQDLAKLTTEIHSRFAMSASCFFFALLGAPFSILQGKRQFLTSFFLCFMPILMIYYPVSLLMMNLCKTRTLDPVYAMWLGNALLLMAGIAVLRRVMRH